jgi:hypothetical protein
MARFFERRAGPLFCASTTGPNHTSACAAVQTNVDYRYVDYRSPPCPAAHIFISEFGSAAYWCQRSVRLHMIAQPVTRSTNARV